VKLCHIILRHSVLWPNGVPEIDADPKTFSIPPPSLYLYPLPPFRHTNYKKIVCQNESEHISLRQKSKKNIGGGDTALFPDLSLHLGRAKAPPAASTPTSSQQLRPPHCLRPGDAPHTVQAST